MLAYGNTRELVLGIEVVLPSGEVWDGLRTLRKDNTGYDLRDIFIGAEGTLGIITGAVLKLFPKPKGVAVPPPARAAARRFPPRPRAPRSRPRPGSRPPPPTSTSTASRT